MAIILYIADPHSLFLVPLITAGAANAHLIHPALSSASPSSFVPSSNPPRPGRRLRKHLTNWTVRSMGFNEFPGLPDKFSPPASSSGSYRNDYGYDITPEERACYRAHYFPDFRDLRLIREKKHNSQAVEMEIAPRAEVSFGNGVRHLVFVCCCRSVMGGGAYGAGC
jgi:hypothetical protein